MEKIGYQLSPEEQDQIRALIESGFGPNKATNIVLNDGSTLTPRGPDDGEFNSSDPRPQSDDPDEDGHALVA